ncbi:MAG TPA: peptide chain release factor N(5)-glutamine methyltransferase [Chloroflexota bacterium]|nr:peptide chain release factor N(5)-glutamine methyltransferase [Chloroflexota bacterium]
MARNVGEARKNALDRLRDGLDVDLLLAHALGLSRERLYAHPERPLTTAEQQTFSQYVQRRAAREPLAYIIGRREFYGLALLVDASVLIPRPATECLVERALEWWRGPNIAPHSIEPALIVEAGAGSGAISLALAAELSEVTVIAGELSPAAARIAHENAQRLNLTGRVYPVIADLQPDTGPAPRLLVANLPYIPRAVIDTLEPEVRDHEPRSALDGGADGFDLYRRLLAEMRVAPGGAAVIEISHDQVALVRDAVNRRDPRLTVAVTTDLEGFDRVALIRGFQ